MMQTVPQGSSWPLSIKCSLIGRRLGSILSSPVQIVSQEGASGLERLRAEYVVRIQGQLRKRTDPNPNIPTGMVELVAEQVTCLRPYLEKC